MFYIIGLILAAFAMLLIFFIDVTELTINGEDYEVSLFSVIVFIVGVFSSWALFLLLLCKFLESKEILNTDKTIFKFKGHKK